MRENFKIENTVLIMKIIEKCEIYKLKTVLEPVLEGIMP